jgi:hypothetical protein
VAPLAFTRASVVLGRCAERHDAVLAKLRAEIAARSAEVVREYEEREAARSKAK